MYFGRSPDERPLTEPGDLVQCIAEIEPRSIVNTKKKPQTLEDIESELGVKLPRTDAYYFVRESYLNDKGHEFIRLEEIYNPILPGNTIEVSFALYMFQKVDSVHNKIQL